MERHTSLWLRVLAGCALVLGLAGPLRTARAIDRGPDIALDAPGWELTRDEDGIRSYKRMLEGSSLLAFRAETVIEAPITRVLSVALDAERVGEWIPGLTESTILRWIEPPTEYIQYTRFDAPWPVSDRIFVSRVVLSVDPDSFKSALRYYDVSHMLESEEGIQGHTGGSYYIMEPIDEGRRTWFVGVSVADPRGFVPAWLVNWMGASWPHGTLTRMQQQIARPEIAVLPMLEPLFQGFRPSPDPLDLPEIRASED